MRDSHGRTIDYLRISLTDRCNLRCIYCMPAEGIVQVPHARILRYDEIEKLVRVAAGLGVRRIRLTGGEPLVRKGVTDLVRSLSVIPGIEEYVMFFMSDAMAGIGGRLEAAGMIPAPASEIAEVVDNFMNGVTVSQ